MSPSELKALIRDVPDFPKPGIVFKDITPLLADARGFGAVIEQLAERLQRYQPAGLVAVEARGFIFGGALAQRMQLPLAIVRKPGKLPWTTAMTEYALEYGSGRLEVHTDAVRNGHGYVIIDDVLATGGTAAATAELVRRHGAEVACYAFLMELEFLNGRARLGDVPVEVLVGY
jgi:adenine phosphoribosyltransferase